MQNKLSVSKLSMRGATALLITIFISNNNVIGIAEGVGTDTWIAQLMSILTVAPLLLILARLMRLMPGMNLFDMMDYLFGRFATAVLSALYFYYFVTVVAIVRMYYAEFVRLSTLVNTPLIVILFSFFVVCTYLTKSGTEALGKWSVMMVILAVLVVLLITVFSFPNMKVAHLMPVGTHSPLEIFKASYRYAVLPLGEAVILLTLAEGMDKKVNPYKLLFLGVGIAIAIFVVTFLRNCAVLGEMNMVTMNYASYKAASVIHIGSIGTRVETLVTISFILTGITKVSICLLASAKGAARVFRLPDENPLIIPVSFFSIGLSAIVFRNMIEMFTYSKVYLVYAPVFQALVPLVMWIVAEVKTRKQPVPAPHAR